MRGKSGFRMMATALAAACAMAALPGNAAGPQGVTRIDTGVHRIGKAEAPLTLTEYVSYTCPHCAHFEHEAGKELIVAYAATGKASVVVRNMVRDPADLAAALLTNCGGDDRFIANHGAVMGAQDEWLGRLRAATPAQRARYETGSFGSRMQALARDAGLYDIMVRRGYEKAQLDRCLADEAKARQLSANAASYRAQGVSGTPSFAIGDVLLAGTHDWASLKPQLDVRIDR